MVTGSDDMLVRVFNYNTLEKSHSFEAHTDYIRSIAVHPTHPYILTSSGKSLLSLCIKHIFSRMWFRGLLDTGDRVELCRRCSRDIIQELIPGMLQLSY